MTLIRDNLMTREGYSPYCGASYSVACENPRTEFNGTQFECNRCGWVSSFDDDFIKEYKKKWGIK